jgi:ABC-type molybdenum transport system ATPase subunit/photorepair protein PhrA
MTDDINDHHQLSNTYAIQLTDITVRLGNKDVLKTINLSIEQGGM